MAKYIIDIPDEYEKCYAQSPSETLYIPMQVGTCDYNIWVGTGLRMTPCTEPDEDEIREKEAEYGEKAWQLFRNICELNETECIEAFGAISCRTVLDEMTYSEAKAKYESWRKQRAEIHVGDEVIYHGDKYVVCYIEANEVYHIIDRNWTKEVVQGDYQLFKTGRHFPEMIY